MRKFLTVLAFMLTVCHVCAQQEMSGFVIKVSDGDTYSMVLQDGTKERVRLQGIDAPEGTGNQPYWQQSRNYLAKLIDKKQVKVRFKNRDKYGRILGTVSVDSIADVNLQMIKSGLAWHYSYYDKTLEYAEAEKNARNLKLGLWSDPNPVQPYEWRRMNK